MIKNPLLKLQVLMANKGKIKIKKPKKWLYPMAAERSYKRQLSEINKIFYNKVKENIIPRLANLVAQARSLRPDSIDSRLDATWVDQLKELIDSTYFDFISIISLNKISKITVEQAEKISLMNKQQFVKTIQSSLSVNPIIQESYLETQLKIFQNQNIDLITKLGIDQKERVRQILYFNLSQGNGIEKIKQELINAESIGENRARLIARDQTNKFNGQLTQLRQQELGITSYVWTTAQDERVRPTHKVLDGETFTWEKGPKIGHPGNEINCRCIAQPIITASMFD
jgi:SPP1 gp7 family putative phage head morphogenesis protein